ncbi:MAG: hypothetical protein KGK03_11010, partial [Candidatus Omnitrophica bacterium]|nr:hypothetical protein [Candidatus Omnitrophota bacterium]
RHGKTAQGEEKICIFIDDAQIFSYDYDVLRMKKMDGQRYLDKMNSLFNRIEKETGLDIVIAAHPASRYEEYPGAFKGRKIIKGKTIELVAKCRLVIEHSSTAISYAIFFNKPVLFVKTDDMVKAKRDIFIDAMANALGLVPLNLDDPRQMQDLSERINDGANAKFSDYKHKYLVTPGIENRNSWDIVAEELKKEPSTDILQDAEGACGEKADVTL